MENVIIIGANQQGRSIYQFLAHLPQRGLKPLGFIDDNPGKYWKLEKDLQLEFLGTTDAEDLRLQFVSATSAIFTRKPRGLATVLEQDTITYDASDEVSVKALGGDDLIVVDLAFTILGVVDGGDGTDTCTAPAAWTKVSC